MGRSRGGLTTKIHALVDANGLPVAIKLTEGQAHDGRSAEDMLGGLTAGQSHPIRKACRKLPGRIKLAAVRIWLRHNESVT